MPPDVYAGVRTRTIFECHKWDPQVGDVNILADYPLVMERAEWDVIARLAEQLAAETIAAERELRRRPDLFRQLGLPGAVVRLLKRPPRAETVSHIFFIRFDFHWTPEGWRISEANSDVPGGLIESTGFTRLTAEQYPDLVLVGDPADMLAKTICARVPQGGLVALVHATAYSDDRQMMEFLSEHLEREGLRTVMVSPAHLRWQDGRAELSTGWSREPVDFVYRFFPSEWLPNLPRASGWQGFFDSATPCCSPATALLTQSKRLPLVWDNLQTPMPTWRSLLPETRAPRTVDGIPERWIFKPAFGRVGEDIALAGVTPEKEWKAIQRRARHRPNDWIAQRRFDMLPMMTEDGPRYPCVGVYTVNGQAAGAYGRLGTKPIINAVAQDIAVLTRGDNHV